MTVEDREADTDQRHFELFTQGQRVALDELGVGVADHEVGFLGQHQRTEVPQVGTREQLGVLAVGGFGKHLFHSLRPLLAAVVA